MNAKPIDANHAAEKLREVLINWIDQDYCDHQLALAVEDKITEALNALSALDYAPVVHAHWEEQHYYDCGELTHDIVCSNCKESDILPYSRAYCSFCGAIMDNSGDMSKCCIEDMDTLLKDLNHDIDYPEFAYPEFEKDEEED